MGESWFIASNQENGEWFYIHFTEFTGNWCYKLANWRTGNTMELPLFYHLLLLLHSFALFFDFFLSLLIWPYFPFLLFFSFLRSSITSLFLLPFLLLLFNFLPFFTFLPFSFRSFRSSFLPLCFFPFSFTLPNRLGSTWAIFRTLTVLLSLSCAHRCVAHPGRHLDQGSLRFKPTTHCV